MNQGARLLGKLALRGTQIDELRDLAARFITPETEAVHTLDWNQLISLLSRNLDQNSALSEAIGQRPISFKPSFYLMVLAPGSGNRPSQEVAISNLERGFSKQEKLVSNLPGIPARKGFEVVDLIESDRDTVEIHLTWHKIHWYWEPTEVTRSHIYELQYGLIILDFISRKAIVACHTERVRDSIVDVVASTYDVKLTPMVLTRHVLDQIGKFDYVKRATYFIENPDPHTPANITYSDDKLATRSLARTEEEHSRSVRKLSYYQIPLASIEEQGIGATSDSGKLWFTRELPLDSIREYGIALLQRVGGTLDAMSNRGDYSEVLLTMGISKLPGMSQIKNTRVRGEVYRLLDSLVNMLLCKEESRAFTLSVGLLGKLIPQYFDYPRLQLTDPETGDVAYWSEPRDRSQLIIPRVRSGEVVLVSHPGKVGIDLSSLRHPITSAEIEVARPLDALHLIPTKKLCDILMEAIEHIATQIDRLDSVRLLPFQIQSNQLLLDVRRALNRANLDFVPTVIYPRELTEFRSLQHSASSTEGQRLTTLLNKLGEMCINMSDVNCQLCTLQSRYLCLRSLVARFLREPLLLSHKGIELSDIQGIFHFGSDQLKAFGFAKMGSSKNFSLTARNPNGASLLSQVLSQVDKTTFNVVVVISPSTINEDLRQRLEMVCGLFRKRLLFVDLPVLQSMLKYIEEQFEFGRLDIAQVYLDSGVEI